MTLRNTLLALSLALCLLQPSAQATAPATDAPAAPAQSPGRPMSPAPLPDSDEGSAPEDRGIRLGRPSGLRR